MNRIWKKVHWNSKINRIIKCPNFITYLSFHTETDIVWPCWKRFSTKDLEATEIREYMRKVFTKKYNGSPDELIGWSFFGTQGVESSYVYKGIGEIFFVKRSLNR